MSGPAYHARTHLAGGTDPLRGLLPAIGGTIDASNPRCPVPAATANSTKPPVTGPTRPATGRHATYTARTGTVRGVAAG